MPSNSRLACLTGLLIASAGSAQTACLDQSYLPNPLTNGLEVTANQPVTQTFTVGMTGQLLQVELARFRHHNGVSTVPVQVDIVTTDVTGVPTGIMLATVTLQPATIPTSIAPVLIDLSAFNVQVTAGQMLGIALTSPNAAGMPSYAWWGEAPASAYAGGQVFIQQTVALPAWDLAFQTWVATPATATTYGTGHAGTNGVPSLLSSAPPVIGTTPNVLLGNSATAQTLGALFYALAPANVSTPFGGTALVLPVASVGVVVPTAGAQIPFPIPNNPALCGFVVDMQAVLIDAGASHGIAFTPGLEYVVGG